MTCFLITGAARGIGLELCKQLIKRGDQIIATVRSEGSATELNYLVNNSRVNKNQVLLMDVKDRASIEKAFLKVHSPIDVIINNAGVIGPDNQSTLEMDFEGFINTIEINTLGPLAVTQTFLPQLRLSNKPVIVFISSKMGSFSYSKDDLIAYQASKAALNKIAKGLSLTLGPSGIIVTAIHPGLVRTELAGERATISPIAISTLESAVSVLRVVDNLQNTDNGKFLNYSGDEISW